MSIAQIIFFNSVAITKIIKTRTAYDLNQTVAAICKSRFYLYIFGLGLMRQFLFLISIDRYIVSTDNARIRRF